MKGWYYLKNCYIKWPTDPKGRERLGVVYLATFESDKIEGIEVLENMWIPLTRKEIDAQSILEMDIVRLPKIHLTKIKILFLLV